MYFMDNMPDETPRFEIRPSTESTFALEVFKTGLMAGKRHILFFEKFSGEIEYDQQQPEKSKARLVVESRSITCKDKWLKPEQRKKVVSAALNEMLSVDQFHEITFTSTTITRKSPNQYEARGDLTIRGTTRAVMVQVAAKPVGSERLELDGEATISMKDYGLKPPSALLGLIGTKDKMELRYLVWAERARSDVRAAS